MPPLRQAESPDEDEVWAIYEIISRTPPASLLGAAVKLRLLLDRELGLDIGISADDMISLRQVAELIERRGRCRPVSNNGDAPDAGAPSR